MVSQTLCPGREERDRTTAGMEAYQSSSSSSSWGQAITNDDPQSEYTYGEFPFESFDLLVDRALEFVTTHDDDNDDDGVESRRGGHREQQRRTMVDLGLGCGRLVFYAALTRGGDGEA